MTTSTLDTPVDTIAFIDLKAQQARVRPQIEARFQQVLDHGAYINGPEVAELESELCTYTGAPHALAVSNGTDALIIPMLALGVGPGDAVFIPALTYNATAGAVCRVGATPVFVDVTASNFTMDPDHLAKQVDAVKAAGKLTPKLVIPVDLFGMPCDYDGLMAVAKAHDLQVMADAAQSFGAQYDGTYAGNITPITGTSFFPAKALGCYGDGGAVFFHDQALRDIAESVRWHGTDDARKDSVRVGMNGRLDSIQCAIVTEKLKIFPSELARRQQIAEQYLQAFDSLIDPLVVPDKGVSSFSLFTVAMAGRDDMHAKLKDAGIPTAIYYKTPLHKMPAFAEFAPADGLPVTEALSHRLLSLPMHPYLTDSQVEKIIKFVVKFA